MVNAKNAIFSLILAVLLILPLYAVHAAMSSANYQIDFDSVSAGGGVSSSSSYSVRDTIGSSEAGASSSSASYSASQGFQTGIFDPVIGFSPYIQDRVTQVAATSLVSSPLSVSVSTVSGLSVGDYILVVQDEGGAQVAMMARIQSISSPTLSLYSNYSGTIPTIDGSNDYVYRMSASASPGFGTLSASLVSTHSVGWVATADVDDGYSVYMFSDGDFRSGSESIAAVADGSVTAGTSEYGGRSSDTSLSSSTFDTQDTAISTTPALVGSAATHPFTSSGFVTLKASISASQTAGSYSQVLTMIFVGEY